MPITKNCPICGSSNNDVFIDGEDRVLTLSNVGSSRDALSHGRILSCRDCRFCFRQLRPHDYELAALYRDASDEIYEQEMAGRSTTARKYACLVQKYQAKAGTLLDVGCASGAFLRIMADCGWIVTGVEPSENHYRRALRHLDGLGIVQQRTLQSSELTHGFDVVTMWDVLEHVTEPVKFMRKCGDLLRPGGHLFVKTPNINSIQARLMNARWPLLLAEHLNYFNTESLRLCGKQAGLRWLRFGRSAVRFSIGYVLFRLSQHDIPGAAMAHQVVLRSPVRSWTVPIFMGELFSVWQRPLDLIE